MFATSSPRLTPHELLARTTKSSAPPLAGRIISIASQVVAVEFLGDTRRYRNHSTKHLRQAVAQGGADVVVDESRSLLQVRQPDDSKLLVHAPEVITDSVYYGFSIAPAVDPWRRCRTDPQTRFDDVSLQERIRTHGGTTAPSPEFMVGGAMRSIAQTGRGHVLVLWMGPGRAWAIETTPATEYLHRNGKAASSADLRVGAFVEVSGRIDRAKLTATSVTG